jgi:hypothetical protein
VGSADEVLQTLIRLRADPDLRAAVARNCAGRAAGVDPLRIAETWAKYLNSVAVPAWREWQHRSDASRTAFQVARIARYTQFKGVDFAMRGMSFVRKRMRALSP